MTTPEDKQEGEADMAEAREFAEKAAGYPQVAPLATANLARAFLALDAAAGEVIGMIENCAGVPDNPDSLVQMIRVRLQAVRGKP